MTILDRKEQEHNKDHQLFAPVDDDEMGERLPGLFSADTVDKDGHECQIEVLEWNEHIRRRPEMYLDSIDVQSLLRGVVDTFRNELGAGDSRTITSKVAGKEVVVEKEWDGVPPLSVILATSGLPVGRGASAQPNRAYIGFKTANALSSEFFIEVRREGVRSWARYSRGYLLDQRVEASTGPDGVRVQFIPDETIFPNFSVTATF